MFITAPVQNITAPPRPALTCPRLKRKLKVLTPITGSLVSNKAFCAAEEIV
jgi:hypothetical protein